MINNGTLLQNRDGSVKNPGKRVARVNTILLTTIASLLLVNIYLDYGKPFFLLSEKSAIYSSHYIDCERAQKSELELKLGVGLNQRGKDRLFKSLEIEKLSCSEKSLLQQQMLSAGVKLEQVRALEISAAMRTY